MYKNKIFIKEVSSISITTGDTGFTVELFQGFDETEDKFILTCAEVIDQFKRGFTCDIQINFNLIDYGHNDAGVKREVIRDLVLVHIRKHMEDCNRPEFEYVFYK